MTEDEVRQRLEGLEATVDMLVGENARLVALISRTAQIAQSANSVASKLSPIGGPRKPVKQKDDARYLFPQLHPQKD